MKFKEKIKALHEIANEKFNEQFGFKSKDTSFDKIVSYLHTPKHASSLAVTRILFGFMMLFDIPDERGGAAMDERWGDPKICHFPLTSFIQAVPLPYMAVVYACLWIGALGIMLGYKFRISASLFTTCYWYLFLIEKSYWNNHTYLFGLVSFLLTCTDANCYWSLDAILESGKFSETVPYWNYFILKYQFFILYFIAGLKKGTAEWLTGYSVPNLSAHWVFTPFTLFFTVEQTDYIVVHWFIFLFDLTIAFWMMWSRTRHIAMVFCALFHLMNSRLFTIGMFPWVCLATMPLFYPFDWPIIIFNAIKSYYMTLNAKVYRRIFCKSPDVEEKNELAEQHETDDDDDDVFEKEPKKSESDRHPINTKLGNSNQPRIVTESDHPNPSSGKTNTSSKDLNFLSDKKNCKEQSNKIEVECRKKITTLLIVLYMTMQGFLPFSHFITKGYNNWTNGLYGYSWDMMVHTWDVQSVIVKIIDNERNKQFYNDPYVLTPNDRWFKHGDMVHQYALCLKNNLAKESRKPFKKLVIPSENISVYIDVWCSMNGRFAQRMFDPKVDLLKVSWSIFQDIPFLMPLIDNASEWRTISDQIRSDVHSWNEYSDVVFFADFPGYDLEKYVPVEFSNVTLTILGGQVAFEPEVTKHHNGQSYQLKSGFGTRITAGMFHRVLNIGNETAFYMYTFYNTTEYNLKKGNNVKLNSNLPILMELERRFRNMLIFANNVLHELTELFFWMPMFLV